MAHNQPFHKLVLIGDLYEDVFNMTLSIVANDVTVPEVSQELADSVAAKAAAWWPKTVGQGGAGITSSAVLRSIKLNRIGTDGRYMDNETVFKDLASPVAGGIAGPQPAQLACAVTFEGINPRARAGRGRMYLPAVGAYASLGSDGRVTAASALAIANGVKSLLTDITASYVALSISARPGITSKVGAGADQFIRRVSVGRVPDTIRSRRSKLIEDRQGVDYDPV